MTVQQQIVDLIATTFPGVHAAKLDPEKALELQGLDSLDMSNLLFALEDRFDRRVSTSDVSLLRSVHDLTEFFAPKQESEA